MEYEKRRNELMELSSWDEAGYYETDEGGLYLDLETKEIVFLSASGCSCWDGEYDEDKFSTLAEAKKALIQGDENGNDLYRYSPSLLTCKRLFEEAEKRLPTSMLAISKDAEKIDRLLQLRGELSTGEWVLFLGYANHKILMELLAREP